MNITNEELKAILLAHGKWLRGEKEGQCANLQGANLQGANLFCASLRSANLTGANLFGANLHGANLFCANLQGANLFCANLQGVDLAGASLRSANLTGADLQGANLQGADLEGADLEGANLEGANLEGANLGARSIVPQEGEFIAYKKVSGGTILRLLIPEYAARVSSYVGRKCRASHAIVISASAPGEEFRSTHDDRFVYRVGQEVSVPDFDPDVRIECTKGIHFFITKEEAEQY